MVVGAGSVTAAEVTAELVAGAAESAGVGTVVCGAAGAAAVLAVVSATVVAGTVIIADATQSARA